MGSFPKVGCTMLGVPIVGIIVSWGLYLGPPILGNSSRVPFRYLQI